MSEAKKAKFKADGTVAGCIGLKKPIPPNRCEECRKHSDTTCENLNPKEAKNVRKK